MPDDVEANAFPRFSDVGPQTRRLRAAVINQDALLTIFKDLANPAYRTSLLGFEEITPYCARTEISTTRVTQPLPEDLAVVGVYAPDPRQRPDAIIMVMSSSTFEPVQPSDMLPEIAFVFRVDL